MNPFKRASSHASPQHDADELRTLITELQRELDADLAKLAEKEHRQVDLIIAKKFEDAAKAATAIASLKAHIEGLRKSVEDRRRMLADKEQEAAAISNKQAREREAGEYKKHLTDYASASAALVRAAQVYAARLSAKLCYVTRDG